MNIKTISHIVVCVCSALFIIYLHGRHVNEKKGKVKKKYMVRTALEINIVIYLSTFIVVVVHVFAVLLLLLLLLWLWLFLLLLLLPYYNYRLYYEFGIFV